MAAARSLPLAWLLAIALGGCAAPPEPEWDWDAMSPESLRAPHGSLEEGFFVPWSRDPKTVTGLLRWQLSANAYDRSTPPQVARVENDGRYLAETEPGASLTWVGHSTFVVHEGDTVWLTDPHFGRRALIPPRLHPPGLPAEAIPADAFAVISHNHYDHLDVDSIEMLPASVHWYVPLGLGDWFRDLDRTRVTELDWWDTVVHEGHEITCLPSQHWSRRIEQGVNASLWCAWLVDSGARRYFFGGDTGYFHGFREYGRLYTDIDVAMLPIGAYAPRWFMKWQHMDPAEAYQAFLDLRARSLAGMHWGTFDLTDEPLDLPPRVLREVVAEQRGDPAAVRVFAVGERWHLPPRLPRVRRDVAPEGRP
ncbi:MAG: MBL fold metallo-hydrolase [Myxococcota bacterium]